MVGTLYDGYWKSGITFYVRDKRLSYHHSGSTNKLSRKQLGELSSVGGITVLCNIRKNDIMPVIMCKNYKHLVTLYNVIFSNITGILSYLSYIF